MNAAAPSIRFQVEFFQPQTQPYLVCRINGVEFDIFSNPLMSEASLTVDLPKAHVVFLQPVVAKTDLSIQARSVIALNSLRALNGRCSIQSTQPMISLSGNVTGSDVEIPKSSIIGKTQEAIRQAFIRTFEKGVKEQSGKKIVDALGDVFGEAEDIKAHAAGAPEDSQIDMRRVFEFFGIATTHPDETLVSS